MKHSAVMLLAALGVLGSWGPRADTENQFADDFGQRQGADRSGARPQNTQPPTARTGAQPTTGEPAATGPGPLIPAVIGLPPAPDTQQSYRIGPNDQLKIRVFQVDELSGEERVSENGQIVMPLIGPVKVAGLTAHEAGTRIAAILGKDYLQNPQVDVYVKEAVSRQITVMGSVVKPGVFPIVGQTTLLQAIALAQGFNPLAKESEVILFRKDDGGQPIAYIVDVKAVQRGKLRDPVLVGDDRVVVPESGTAVFLKGVTDTLRGFVRPLGGY